MNFLILTYWALDFSHFLSIFALYNLYPKPHLFNEHHPMPTMNEDYDRIIDERAQHVFDVMSPRVNDEQMQALQEAFRLAREAHKDQKRKTGEPYILHPIAVATIAAEELQLGADSVMAAFLHDVVEDTPYTIDDLRSRFGNDVTFLVKVVTKLKRMNMWSPSRWTITGRCSTRFRAISAPCL